MSGSKESVRIPTFSFRRDLQNALRDERANRLPLWQALDEIVAQDTELSYSLNFYHISKLMSDIKFPIRHPR